MLVLVLAVQFANAKPPVEWSTPSCELNYSAQTDTTATILDDEGQPVVDTGARRIMGFTLSAKDEGLSLKSTSAHRASLSKGAAGSAQLVPAAHMWSARVQALNGEMVSTELTELWASSRWGLNLAWPALPAGEERSWRVLREHQGRGAGPVDLLVTVRADGEEQHRGHRAYKYTGTWTSEKEDTSNHLDPAGRPTSKRLTLTERGTGTWWVSKSGMLIAAQIDVTTDMLHASASGSQRKQTLQKLGLKQSVVLVDNCKGPVLPAHER